MRKDPFCMTTRLRVIELAHQHGLTLSDMADKMGVDYQTIQNWNSGRAFPPFIKAIELALLLNCVLDELIEHETYQTWVTQNEVQALNGLKRWCTYIHQFKNEPGEWGRLLAVTYRNLF